jgi:hypothetical protein
MPVHPAPEERPIDNRPGQVGDASNIDESMNCSRSDFRIDLLTLSIKHTKMGAVRNLPVNPNILITLCFRCN